MKPILDKFMTQQITAAYVAGYNKCLEDNGQLPKYLSRNKAEGRYGKLLIKELIDRGFITPIRVHKENNGKIMLEREKIELAISANEITPKIKMR